MIASTTFLLEGVTTNAADGNVLFAGFESPTEEGQIEQIFMKAWMKGTDPIDVVPIAMSAPVYEDFNLVVIPEPATMAVFALGGGAMFLRRKFRR
jgi:hypothetical protein